MTNILVVEDERIVAEDIQKSLQKFGYTVSAVVSSGEEAFQEMKEEGADLVLMDIVLKGKMDGIEAAEQLSSIFSIPVVYLTAFADESLLRRAKKTEPYGYVLKPFEDQELHTTIEMALHKFDMEKRVKESHQWLYTILKSIGDGVIATDTEGVVTFMNPVAERLTGWSEKEAVGTHLHDVFYIVSQATGKRCENPFGKILKRGGMVGLANSTILIARDGTERLIADSGAPIRDNNNVILGCVLVFRDVTEKRKMEKNLARLKTEKTESLSVLAGGIAHDFNNILTALLGNISLAKIRTVPENEILTLLTEAEKACFRAKNLTQQLLMFSKEGVPVKRPTSISQLLKDTVEFALRGSNIQCKFYVSENLLPVEIDQGQISQVLNNLVINAEQSMPDGGVIMLRAENVTLRAKNGLPLRGGEYVRIQVEDGGIGIPEEHLQRIFDPYFTTKQKGSGLGLATAYSFIKNHGGHISVKSQLGVGTTFCIWLPASEKEVPPPEEPSKMRKGTGRILVMDDDASILEVTRDVLALLGYKAAFARDGKETCEQYVRALNTGNPFDAVIIDLTVRGGLGGKETIKRLTEVDPAVKAIVSSGYVNHPVMVNFEENGFCGAVSKPFSIEELSETLYEVIHKK